MPTPASRCEVLGSACLECRGEGVPHSPRFTPTCRHLPGNCQVLGSACLEGRASHHLTLLATSVRLRIADARQRPAKDILAGPAAEPSVGAHYTALRLTGTAAGPAVAPSAALLAAGPAVAPSLQRRLFQLSHRPGSRMAYPPWH